MPQNHIGQPTLWLSGTPQQFFERMVETLVAIAQAVSLKPLMYSKASATTMTIRISSMGQPSSLSDLACDRS